MPSNREESTSLKARLKAKLKQAGVQNSDSSSDDEDVKKDATLEKPSKRRNKKSSGVVEKTIDSSDSEEIVPVTKRRTAVSQFLPLVFTIFLIFYKC